MKKGAKVEVEEVEIFPPEIEFNKIQEINHFDFITLFDNPSFSEDMKLEEEEIKMTKVQKREYMKDFRAHCGLSIDIGKHVTLVDVNHVFDIQFELNKDYLLTAKTNQETAVSDIDDKVEEVEAVELS